MADAPRLNAKTWFGECQVQGRFGRFFHVAKSRVAANEPSLAAPIFYSGQSAILAGAFETFTGGCYSLRDRKLRGFLASFSPVTVPIAGNAGPFITVIKTSRRTPSAITKDEIVRSQNNEESRAFLQRVSWNANKQCCSQRKRRSGAPACFTRNSRWNRTKALHDCATNSPALTAVLRILTPGIFMLIHFILTEDRTWRLLKKKKKEASFYYRNESSRGLRKNALAAPEGKKKKL